MFDYYYLTAALRYIDQVPKEVAICVAAYAISTDIFKRYTTMKIEVAKAEAKTRTAELEVEALRLKKELGCRADVPA